MIVLDITTGFYNLVMEHVFVNHNLNIYKSDSALKY